MDYDRLRKDLESATGKRELAEGDSLLAVLGRLDSDVTVRKIPRQLVHYLSKRSYVKALEWMDNPEAPHKI